MTVNVIYKGDKVYSINVDNKLYVFNNNDSNEMKLIYINENNYYVKYNGFNELIGFTLKHKCEIPTLDNFDTLLDNIDGHIKFYTMEDIEFFACIILEYEIYPDLKLPEFDIADLLNTHVIFVNEWTDFIKEYIEPPRIEYIIRFIDDDGILSQEEE